MNGLIGLVGYARSGKDTVAGMLTDLVGAQRVAFADPIRQFVQRTFDFTSEQVWGNLKEVPDTRYKKPDGTFLTPRFAMQFVGTEIGRTLYSNVWIELGLRCAAVCAGPVAIPDVRFLNEADAIRAVGGQIWRVTRKGTEPAPNAHASETEQGSIVADVTLVNDGSLLDLKALVIEAIAATGY